MATKASINQAKYDATHCRMFRIKLNINIDADIIKKLTEQQSMQGYIKQLIRADINKSAPVLEDIARKIEEQEKQKQAEIDGGYESIAEKRQYYISGIVYALEQFGYLVQYTDNTHVYIDTIDSVRTRTDSVPKTEMEDKTMKKYIIKPEYIDNFGSEANAYTVLTEDDVKNYAEYNNISVDDVLEQLIEDDSDKHAWRLLYRFSGTRMSREQINNLISFESGNPEDFFETDEDYNKAIKDGFVKWDWHYTTVWIDD